MTRRLKEKILRYGRSGKYRCVTLCNHDGGREHYVHVLVALVFIGERPEGTEVCHDDGNRDNNAASNIRYDTPSGNQADRVRHGTDARGEKSKLSKLTRHDVLVIRRMSRTMMQKDIAVMFGVSTSTVNDIIRKRNWAWLEEEVA